jgi:hypothetical protein
VEEFVGNLWTRTNLCGRTSEEFVDTHESVRPSSGHGGQHNSARPARYWKFRTGT